MYADQPDFQQTNVIGEMLNEGTGGVTEAEERVIMPFTRRIRGQQSRSRSPAAFTYSIRPGRAERRRNAGTEQSAAVACRRYGGISVARQAGRAHRDVAAYAALRGELPTIKQLTTDPRFFPYRYGQALWAYVGGRWGDRAVTDVFRYATKSGFEATAACARPHERAAVERLASPSVNVSAAARRTSASRRCRHTRACRQGSRRDEFVAVLPPTEST